MKGLSRRGWIGVAVVALLVVAYLATRGGALEVETTAVVLDTMSVTIAVEGRTRARDSYTVTAPVAGRLARLGVEEGDVVAEGQLLVRLSPAPYDPRAEAAARAEVEAARSALLEAESVERSAASQLVQAQREVERRRPIFEIGALTREAMERVELAAEVAAQRRDGAEATTAAARAVLAGAQARLMGAERGQDDTPEILVRSPVSGHVLTVPDQSGRVVPAGAVILSLANTGGLEVVFDVLSEDAVRIERGQDLRVSRWGGEGVLKGSVRRVTMAGYTKVSTLGVEEQRVDVIAELVNVPPTLGTGYRVSGDIIVWRGRNVLTVPTNAIFRAGSGWRVFTVEDGRARSREVSIGRRNERIAEVVGGLEAGERVILFPSELVGDGVRVSPSE